MDSTIILPPRIGRNDIPSIAPGIRRIVVVGANGAGKSRFAARTMELTRQSGVPTFSVSALRGLYSCSTNHIQGHPSDIDRLYSEHVGRSLIRSDIDGEFERLIAVMLDNEAATLLRDKFGGTTPASPTPLERLISLWEEIFPDNRMLLETGRLLFAQRTGDSTADRYDAVRLSDGEKAVIYHIAAALTAPREAILFVDTPGMFLNRAVTGRVWQMVESLREPPIVYTTHDLEFASICAADPLTTTIWVRRYDATARAWDYELLPSGADISDEVFTTLMGARKPVLFIEGDGVNSIDAKLYPRVFPDFTVRSLGSCNKVIEATRTFNSLSRLHNLAAIGIVDRDRRNAREVGYLRSHNVMVPEVAEIENIMMLEEVVRAVAGANGRDGGKAFAKVRRNLINLFSREYRDQALLHTRHYVKMTAEYTIDRRFNGIDSLERHLASLVRQINPRTQYDHLCAEFDRYIRSGDYASILRVYNRKSMIAETNVAALTGCGTDRKAYVRNVLRIVSGQSPYATRIAAAVRRCFGVDEHSNPIVSK